MRPRRWTGHLWRIAAVGALAVGLASACDDQSAQDDQDTDAGRPATIRIGSVDGVATALTASPDGRELLVSTQAGRVVRLTLETSGERVRADPDPEPVIDLSELTLADPPVGGLLGLAITDDGRHLVVHHTTGDGAITVRAFDYAPGARLTVESGRVLMAIPHPYVHNGGAVVAAADGGVFVSIGAMPHADAAPDDPQQPDGRLLRIPAAALDAGAPFVPTAADIIATGMRNPWRVGLDRETGDLWVADVGENRFEEVNRVQAADVGVVAPDFGWPYLESTEPYVEPVDPSRRFQAPVFSYEHGDNRCAIVGGSVYRGDAFADLQGAYLYADYCGPQLRALAVDAVDADGARDRGVVAEVEQNVTALAEGADGEVYVLGAEGGIFRLGGSGWDVDPESEPAGGAAPAPAVVPPATPPVCEVAAAIEAMAGIEEFSPAELEQRLGHLLDTVTEQTPQLPDDLRGEGNYLVGTFGVAVALAEAKAWDASDPEFRRFIQLVNAERGEWASTLRSEFAITNRAETGCS